MPPSSGPTLNQAPGARPARPAMSRRLALAILVSAAVVLTSPFVADVRDALRRAAGAHYSIVINGIVLAAVAAFAAAALQRIRERRLIRYGALAVAIGAGALYVWASALPSVERFHFVEYGLVTWLFYRAMAARPLTIPPAPPADVSLLAVPILAALVVGTADEWVQWFVPRRYGEVRDIFLNMTAIACGLVFSLGAEPPAAWRLRPTPGSVALMTRLAAAAVLALGTFLYAVHLGTWVVDAEIGAFRSRHPAQALLVLSADRASRWGSGVLPEARALAREDRYLTEGVWHVQARNEAWAGGAIETAWRENLILEKYSHPSWARGTPGHPCSARTRRAVRTPKGVARSSAGLSATRS